MKLKKELPILFCYWFIYFSLYFLFVILLCLLSPFSMFPPFPTLLLFLPSLSKVLSAMRLYYHLLLLDLLDFVLVFLVGELGILGWGTSLHLACLQICTWPPCPPWYFAPSPKAFPHQEIWLPPLPPITTTPIWCPPVCPHLCVYLDKIH